MDSILTELTDNIFEKEIMNSPKARKYFAKRCRYEITYETKVATFARYLCSDIGPDYFRLLPRALTAYTAVLSFTTPNDIHLLPNYCDMFTNMLAEFIAHCVAENDSEQAEEILEKLPDEFKEPVDAMEWFQAAAGSGDIAALLLRAIYNKQKCPLSPKEQLKIFSNDDYLKIPTKQIPNNFYEEWDAHFKEMLQKHMPTPESKGTLGIIERYACRVMSSKWTRELLLTIAYNDSYPTVAEEVVLSAALRLVPYIPYLDVLKWCYKIDTDEIRDYLVDNPLEPILVQMVYKYDTKLVKTLQEDLKKADKTINEQKQAIASHDSEVAELKLQISKLTTENTQLHADKKRLKTLVKDDHDAAKLSNSRLEDLTALQQEHKALQEMLDIMSSQLNKLEENNKETSIDYASQIDGFNVAVLGGHPNFITRLKQAHPDWTYIPCEDIVTADTRILDNCDVFLIMTNWNSHKATYKFTKEQYADKYVYCSNNNISIVEQEIYNHLAS